MKCVKSAMCKSASASIVCEMKCLINQLVGKKGGQGEAGERTKNTKNKNRQLVTKL